MPLRINNTDITNLYINGTEYNALRVNDTAYFGKRSTLTGSSTGVSLSVNRTSSPNQQAGIGGLESGSAIFYGDVLTISVTADTNYINPELYVDIGDGYGAMRRTSPFTFTVVSNVTYRGAATYEPWPVVWSGSQTFNAAGSFTVPGLSPYETLQVTAYGQFGQYFVSSGQKIFDRSYSESFTRSELPAEIRVSQAYVRFTQNGDRIDFEFRTYDDIFKGDGTSIIPETITITEVRRRA